MPTIPKKPEDPHMSIAETMERRAQEFVDRYAAVREQIRRVIVGHDEIVHGVLTCLFVGGHCLLEGVPGLGKTLLVRTLAKTLDLDFSRIQFTPDLMPADILGTNMVMETPDGKRFFEFQRGPIFTQICLADEINRATPKTQSAMLETMQEGSVTAAGTRHQLKLPFLVMATQNPIEQEGTYPLPEAQLDRFFFKLVVGYSDRKELATIVNRTTRGENIEPAKVMDGAEILRWQGLVREVILAEHVQDYLVRLVLATHPGGSLALPITNQYIRWGASPRAAQTVALAAKVRALLDGRYNVSFEDVRRVYLPALRHRVILNFEAQAEGIEPDKVLLGIVGKGAGEGGELMGEGGRRKEVEHRKPRGCTKPAGCDWRQCMPTVFLNAKRNRLLTRRKGTHGRDLDTAEPATAGEAGEDGTGQPEDIPRADEGRAAQPAQGAERRVRRLPQLRRRRRPAVRRLEHLRPPGAAVPEDVPGRGGLALLHLDRRQRLDGFRHAHEAGLRHAVGRRLGLRRAGARRPGEDRDPGAAGLAVGPRLPRPPQPVADARATSKASKPGQTASLAEGVKNFCIRNSGRGIVVLLSDLMDKAGYETGPALPGRPRHGRLRDPGPLRRGDATRTSKATCGWSTARTATRPR